MENQLTYSLTHTILLSTGQLIYALKLGWNTLSPAYSTRFVSVPQFELRGVEQRRKFLPEFKDGVLNIIRRNCSRLFLLLFAPSLIKNRLRRPHKRRVCVQKNTHHEHVSKLKPFLHISTFLDYQFYIHSSLYLQISVFEPKKYT